MAKTRPLVNGYLERISVRAFEGYQKEITDLVRSEHGVYALYKDDRLYYVGLAVDLRRRIKRHLRDKHAARWNRFSLYLVRKVDHIKEIEALLLRIAHPAGNKQAGRLRRARNLERRLRRMMKERQSAELDSIFSRSLRARRPPAGPTRRRASKRRAVGSAVRPLKGLVAGGKRIYATYNGREHKAVVYRNGRIKLAAHFYDSPSAAAMAVTGRRTSGWRFWRIRKDGELVRLSDLRKRRKTTPSRRASKSA